MLKDVPQSLENTKKSHVLLIVGALLLIIVHGQRWWSNRPNSPSGLVETALEADESLDRKQAVHELRRDDEAVKHLRTLAAESDDEGVRGAALVGLARHYDYDSMPIIREALEDPSPIVRDRAFKAAGRMLGVRFYHRRASTPEEQELLVREVDKIWDSMNQSGTITRWQERRRGMNADDETDWEEWAKVMQRKFEK